MTEIQANSPQRACSVDSNVEIPRPQGLSDSSVLDTTQRIFGNIADAREPSRTTSYLDDSRPQSTEPHHCESSESLPNSDITIASKVPDRAGTASPFSYPSPRELQTPRAFIESDHITSTRQSIPSHPRLTHPRLTPIRTSPQQPILQTKALEQPVRTGFLNKLKACCNNPSQVLDA